MRGPSALLIPLAVAGALAGCAALDQRDAERERMDALADHALCVHAAHAFPSDGYTTCRRRVAEERQRKQWMELSLAQQQSASRTPDYLPMPPPGVYTPIDPTRYRCVAEADGADQVIVCKER
jgi:hypothetical protein